MQPLLLNIALAAMVQLDLSLGDKVCSASHPTTRASAVWRNLGPGHTPGIREVQLTKVLALSIFTGGLLLGTAAAQTSASSQAAVSGSQNSSVSADRAGAQV